MLALLDAYIPWFNDIVELGGNILIVILLVAALMWGLILERMGFLLVTYRGEASTARALWQQRPEHESWHAQKFRDHLRLLLLRRLKHNLSSIRILIVVCPLLGLLGTVLGMLEVFDGMAAMGSNNPRSTAAGVSKATVSTMAGMVVAISGLMASVFIERTVAAAEGKIGQLLSFEHINNGNGRPSGAQV